MKKAPKTTIFDDQQADTACACIIQYIYLSHEILPRLTCSGEKGNPTYVPPEVAVKTTEFAEKVEIELVEEHSVQ